MPEKREKGQNYSGKYSFKHIFLPIGGLPLRNVGIKDIQLANQEKRSTSMTIEQLKIGAEKRKNPDRTIIQSKRSGERSSLKEFLKQRKKSYTQ